MYSMFQHKVFKFLKVFIQNLIEKNTWQSSMLKQENTHQIYRMSSAKCLSEWFNMKQSIIFILSIQFENKNAINKLSVHHTYF